MLLYDQTDGVGMGSPLAPVLTNLFMGHHESIWLEEYNQSSLLFIDATLMTFCVFETEHDALVFRDFKTCQHTFCYEIQKDFDNKIRFLDVMIHNTQLGPTTTVIHKETFCTGLLINYFSFTASCYKISLVRTLVDRAFKINKSG